MYVCAHAESRPPGTRTPGPLTPSDSASGQALGILQAAAASSSAVTETEGGGEVSGPDRWVSGTRAWRSVKPAARTPARVHTARAVPGSLTHLELPVGRLQQLLRLIGRTARRQHELVDHDLVFELVHVHGHGAAAQPAPASLRASLTRPPLASRPRLIQIFTVRSDSPRLATGRPAKHAGMCSPRRPRRMDRGGAWTPSSWLISVGSAAPTPG